MERTKEVVFSMQILPFLGKSVSHYVQTLSFLFLPQCLWLNRSCRFLKKYKILQILFCRGKAGHIYTAQTAALLQPPSVACLQSYFHGYLIAASVVVIPRKMHFSDLGLIRRVEISHFPSSGYRTYHFSQLHNAGWAMEALEWLTVFWDCFIFDCLICTDTEMQVSRTTTACLC